MIPDVSWMRSGLCREVDPDLFFTEGYGRPAAEREVIAKICNQCSVIFECREYAVNHPEPQYGVWGGLRERDLATLRFRVGQKPGFARKRPSDAQVA